MNTQIVIIEKLCPTYKVNKSKHYIRHDFFKEICTEIQAYLLGFFIADGSINEKRKTFSVELQHDDIEIINLFKQFICQDAYTFYKKYNNVKSRGKLVISHGNVGININSSILCNSLVNLGYGYRKTYSELKFSDKIPYSLIRHLIRGFFDGDGSFSYSRVFDKTKQKYYLKQNISICSKTKSFLTDIQCFLHNFNITSNVLFLKRDDMWRLSISSDSGVRDFYNLIYNDSTFYLSRKHNKFIQYVNTERDKLMAILCNAQENNSHELANTKQ